MVEFALDSVGDWIFFIVKSDPAVTMGQSDRKESFGS